MPASKPAEFRRRAVDLARSGPAPVAKIAADLGISQLCLRRSIPWARRPEASRPLTALKDPLRGWDGIVGGEPQRAFYGSQFQMTFPVPTHYGV